ncbi:hypothetical protein [Marininema mesophilum]|nr:hypothetical protein [Marininema mesophilum]
MVFIGISPIYQECVDLGSSSSRYQPPEERITPVQVKKSTMERSLVGRFPLVLESHPTEANAPESPLGYQPEVRRGPPNEKRGPVDAGLPD